MRTDYIPRRELEHLLSALMPENRLALEISLHTGLRISDVLNLRSERLSQRMTIKELKTGKKRSVSLTAELYARCKAMAGKYFVFEGRTNVLKSRTRQAVFKDLKRVAHIFRLKPNVAPHTARKVYSVDQYAKTRDLAKVQHLLNHRDQAVTVLYAMADQLTERTLSGKHTKCVK